MNTRRMRPELMVGTTILDTSLDNRYILTVSELTANRELNFPLLTANDTFAMVTLAQTLTNKTLTSPVLTTPEINDTSADHQYVFAVSELTADRTVTLPLLTANANFVFDSFANVFTANQVMTNSSGSNARVLEVRSTQDAATGPRLVIRLDRATPAAADVVGILEFRGDDAAGTDNRFASIFGIADDVTDASEDGQLDFRVFVAGTETSMLVLQNTRIGIGVGVIGGGANTGASDTTLARGAANRWDIGSGDDLTMALANFKVGGTAAHATTAGTNIISLFTGTAPAGTLASGGSLYVATATNVELNYIDSAGNAQQLSTT